MPRTRTGPTCAWEKGCKMPVCQTGDWCHRHRGLVPREEFRRVFIERSQREAVRHEAEDSRRDFANTALKHGIDSIEAHRAYGRMLAANGPNPPVPEWWGKP